LATWEQKVPDPVISGSTKRSFFRTSRASPKEKWPFSLIWSWGRPYSHLIRFQNRGCCRFEPIMFSVPPMKSTLSSPWC